MDRIDNGRVPLVPGFRRLDQAAARLDASRIDPSRWYWDKRPAPGKTNDDPMCINLFCPSAFSCRRFSQEPYQGEAGPTIFIDPKPDLLGGRLCKDFDPDCPRPSRDSDESGEAGETVGLDPKGDSAGAQHIAPNQSGDS